MNEIFVHQTDVSYWFYVTIMSSRVRTSTQHGYIESINKEIRSAEVVFQSIKGEKVGYFQSSDESESLLSCYIVDQSEVCHNLFKGHTVLLFYKLHGNNSDCYIVDSFR